jgi:hypothetical protein
MECDVQGYGVDVSRRCTLHFLESRSDLGKRVGYLSLGRQRCGLAFECKPNLRELDDQIA